MRAYFSNFAATARRASLLAVAASLLCPLAQAVYLSPNQEGQALIFPYYSLRGEVDTLISISNHRDDIKALRVNILEGDAGRVIQYFNLYLSPHDTWTGSLSVFADEPALVSADSSCTVPNFFDDSFGVVPLDRNLLDLAPDSGRSSLDRVFEGMVQVIEMGVLAADGLGANALIEAFNSDPNDCFALVDAWTEPDGVWVDDPHSDLSPPSGGISGDGVIINVVEARASAFQAAALADFYVPTAEQAPSLHSNPLILSSAPQPDLGQASPPRSQLLNRTPGGLLNVVEDTWDTAYQAVSAALMAETLGNQYASQAVINGRTEWVFSFPTKYLATAAGTPLPPFSSSFDEPGPGQGDGGACEPYSIEVRDRNGVFVPATGVIGVPPPNLFQYCYAVNVHSFGNSQRPSLGAGAAQLHEAQDLRSDLLASRLLSDVPLEDAGARSEAGQAQVRFDQLLINSGSGQFYYGLPVVGFAVQGAQNRALNALFGVGFTHQRQSHVESPQ